MIPRLERGESKTGQKGTEDWPLILDFAPKRAQHAVPLQGKENQARKTEEIRGSSWAEFKEDDLGWPRRECDTCVTDGF